MAFEVENNLLNNPNSLIRAIWRNNQEAVQANLAEVGASDVTSYEDLLQALLEIYQAEGTGGVISVLSVPLDLNTMDPGERAAFANLDATFRSGYRSGWGLDATDGGLYDPNDEYFEVEGDANNPGGDGSGQGWEIANNVLNLAGDVINAFFGGGNNQQQQPPPGQYPGMPPQQSKGPSVIMIIGLVLLAAALVGLVVYAVNKKGKNGK